MAQRSEPIRGSDVPGADGSRGLHIRSEPLESVESCALVTVVGCLDAGTASQLAEHVDHLSRDGDTRLIFDLGGVYYLSSTGIDCFTRAMKAVKPRGGDIVLVNLNERISDVLRMYGFETAFPIRGSVAEAISYHSPSSPAATDIRFPLYVRCPVCSASLKLTKPMCFRCTGCQSVMTVDAGGSITPQHSPKGQAEGPAPKDPRLSPVQIAGQLELIHILESGGAHHTHCVSIGNPPRLFGKSGPDTRMPPIFKKHFQSTLRLEFYDVEEKKYLLKWQFPKRIPRRRDVRKAIRFFRRTRGSATGFTIHCWQGVSRSTAFALGFLFMLTGSERKAKQLLQEERPDAGPHQRIVQWFDDELGSDLASVNEEIRKERIERWKRELGMVDSAAAEVPSASDGTA